jgi:hypothetical protein
MGLDMMLIHDVEEWNEVGYWRKANAIHRWFVDNVQNGVDDCGEYKVTAEQLIQLRDECNQVLNDSSLAESLLPTQPGFFFGGTEYNDGYVYDLENTVEIINDILENKQYCLDDLYYSSSW